MSKPLTWRDIRGPVSVTVACAVGMSLALVDEHYFPFSPFALKAGGVIGTTLMVMDMASAEKFYLKIFFRTIGTVGGVALGLWYSVLESHVAATYKASAKERHADDWILVAFRIALLVPTIFICGVLGKIRPVYAYPLVVFAVQVPGGLFAKSVRDATGIALSSICAVLVAVFSIVIFENFNAESLLMETSNKAIQGVLTIFSLAAHAEAQNLDPFVESAEKVHKAINAAESSIATYHEWRAVTWREVEHDFTGIVKALKPLFYQSYSLFWTNTASFNAQDYRADILFCDSPELFNQHFKSLVEEIQIAVNGIKHQLEVFFATQFRQPLEVEAMLEAVIHSFLWNGLVSIQDHLRAQYIEHRSKTHTSFAQRWNMADYLRQFSLMTLALVEYVRALTLLFLIHEEDMQTKLLHQIDDLSDALDQMRNKEDPGVVGGKSRTSSKTSFPADFPESPTKQ